MTEVLGGLGITEYSTGKADFALSCKDCVTYTVDRKELVEAIDQNINLSELLSRKFETLLRATTEYDTIEPEESQTLLRATSLPLVRYGAINSVISITCSKVFEHMDEVNDITEMVQKALACAGQKVELTLNSRAGCSVSYKIDSDQLLAALKVNPDRVNYNDGHGRSF